MKKVVKTLVLLAAFMLLTSFARVTLTLVRPAELTIPQHIQTLIVIDRTLPADEKKNKREEILTGEAFHQDQQAVEQSMEGVIRTVMNTPRFQIVRTTEKFQGSTTGTLFPEPLSWEIIDQLCQKYGADAVISIESFDSDYIITAGGKILPQRDNPGRLLPVGVSIGGVATVNIGFRLYDPATRSIDDEFKFSHKMNFGGQMNSVTDVANGILAKTDAINQVSYVAGQIYGERICPSYYRVTRYFYDKPKRNKKLREGVRKSEVADWNGAIESWKEALQVAKKRKHKGRLCLNIAVGYEVLGDMDQALDWASKSYTDYREKLADDYVRALRQRINEENVARSQLSHLLFSTFRSLSFAICHI